MSLPALTPDAASRSTRRPPSAHPPLSLSNPPRQQCHTRGPCDDTVNRFIPLEPPSAKFCAGPVAPKPSRISKSFIDRGSEPFFATARKHRISHVLKIGGSLLRPRQTLVSHAYMFCFFYAQAAATARPPPWMNQRKNVAHFAQLR